eukprot:Hpha_TRINITY_DN16326_c1_g3::TRINITY_DN16326_c1_g3_i1::g.60210::m.60210
MGCGASQAKQSESSKKYGKAVVIDVSPRGGDQTPLTTGSARTSVDTSPLSPREEGDQNGHGHGRKRGELHSIRVELSELKSSIRGLHTKLHRVEHFPDRPIVHRVVMTGGPCGGKSSGMHKLKSMLEEQGLGVYVAPEAATLLLGNGADAIFRAPDNRRDACLYAFQKTILLTQIGLEDSFIRLAKSVGKPAVLLCDRGVLDGKAYADPEMWQNLLAECGMSEADLFRRYDAVVHMVTAADGAEDCYGSENNSARTETAQQARDVDEKLRSCYGGHPAVHLIDNSTGFQEKVERAVQPIMQLVGKARAVGPRQKYLLPAPVDASLIPTTPIKAISTFIYLLGSTPNNLRRLRVRELNETRQYSYQQVTTVGTHRRSIAPPTGRVRGSEVMRNSEVVLSGPSPSSTAGPGKSPAIGRYESTFRSDDHPDDQQRMLKERVLTEKEFERFALQADPLCPIVRREHHFFCLRSVYFDIATFTDPPEKQGVTLVTVEAGRAKDGTPGSVEIPSFLTGGLPLPPEASRPKLDDVIGFNPGIFAQRTSLSSVVDLAGYRMPDDHDKPLLSPKSAANLTADDMRQPSMLTRRAFLGQSTGTQSV